MNSQSKKIFIHAKYVCERAKTDARKLAIYFTENGYKIVDNPKKADLIIFNSCGYSNPLAQHCLNEIKKLKKYDAELIVVGGLPETDKEEFEKIFNGKTLSHKDIDKIDTFFPQHAIKFNTVRDCNISWMTIDETTPKDIIKKIAIQNPLTKKIYVSLFDYYFQKTIGKNYLILSNPLDIPTDHIYRIEIARGCSFHCSYCAIRKSIGPFQSKPLNNCINEFKQGLKNRYNTFYITAPDPGCYGTDIGTTYPTLLQQITSFDGDYLITLDGLNPVWLVQYIKEIEEILKTKKINAISVPIQSGNTRILKLMNRFSNTEKIKDALLRIKQNYPNVTLATGCIIGFPTETEQEFKETIMFIEDVQFDIGFLNPISIKSNTKAEQIDPKISKEEITKRIHYAKKHLKQRGYNTVYTKTGGVVFGGKHK